MSELLTRDTARVGATVIFRGERRKIDLVCSSGVWLSATSKSLRNFLYWWEARHFGVNLMSAGGKKRGVVQR